MTQITFPEGNKVQYTYDARGNVTQTRRISKTPGTPPDIVETASYPAGCSNPLTCNKPSSSADARGNVTNYAYDATHGGILTVTQPAPATGAVRPQVRYTYASKYAYLKAGNGTIVAYWNPIWLPTTASTCQTLASCSGAADEVKTTIDYGPQVNGTPNNLLPVSISSGSGNGTLTATVANTYDSVGNLTYVDGPLSGTADTTRTLYDAVRHVVGQIGPDPDGPGVGTLPNRATRLSYNLDGQVTKTESGTTLGQDDTAWASFSPAEFVETAYDASGRTSTETLKNGTTSFALTQYTATIPSAGSSALLLA